MGVRAMPDKKWTSTCAACGEVKFNKFRKGMCNACNLRSLKATATCVACGEVKFGKFVNGACNACYMRSRKATATCVECSETKFDRFTSGRCTACYMRNTKATATCVECNETKFDYFTSGRCKACRKRNSKATATCVQCNVTKFGYFTASGHCGACYKRNSKATATCVACNETKFDYFVGGQCGACYKRNSKATATCVECNETRFDLFRGGRCRACYRKQPHLRAAANARDRKRRREDEAYRIQTCLSAGLRSMLGGGKSAPTLEIIGSSLEGLLEHFASTLHEGCGESPHIGHVLVPSSWAVRHGDEAVRLCFQLPNLGYQNAAENLALGARPWYDCPFITSGTIEVASRFLALAGTATPELNELAKFVDAWPTARS